MTQNVTAPAQSPGRRQPSSRRWTSSRIPRDHPYADLPGVPKGPPAPAWRATA